VGLVVAMEGIELAGGQEAEQAQLAWASDVCVQERLEDTGDAGALDELASQVQFGTARRPAPTRVEGWAHQRDASRNMKSLSASGIEVTNARRSDSTVAPLSPAAAASSGKRVPAFRCHSSQVERSREAESRG
jgi:hypothetical protein